MRRPLSVPSVPARLLAVAVMVACLAAPWPALARVHDPALQQAKHDLHETKDKIRARAVRLRELGRDMNAIATEISNDESLVAEASDRIAALEVQIRILEARDQRLQQQLGDRNRAAYILGPTAPVLYLLTATSPADAAARMSIITEMNRRDQLLAAKVDRNDERLDRGRAESARMQRARQLALQQLQVDRAALQAKLAASRRLFDQLQARKDDILETISKIRPFAVCPVQGPVAIADDFGIWVHRSEARGGDHVHQGNDMMAAFGTPIVAPFDGTAVVATNKIGGNAVKVYGDYGYVYNAHLSSFGKLGPVQAGDVIGYVGNTGNTDANHDHFEWHPGNGAAVDPHGFLLLVC